MRKKIIYNFDKKDKVYFGNILDERQEMKRKILTGFRDNDKVSLLDFERYFGKDLLTEFKEEFKVLKYLGKIKICNDYVYFLEKNKKMRMLYSMFIVGRNDIKKSLESNHWYDIKW